jgi:outer membrane protein
LDNHVKNLYGARAASAIVVLLFVLPLAAQRIAFVNTKYILGQLPEYEQAQKELDKVSNQWQKEIEGRYDQISRLREAYQAEAILLTEAMKQLRLQDLEKKEREARDLQKQRFGVEGDLFKKRQELLQPIQDQVYQAIKEVAGTSYVAIFDIGGPNNNVLFASEKYDKSDSVLRKMGVRPDKDGGGQQKSDNDEPDGDTPDDAPEQAVPQGMGGEKPR